MIATLNRLAPHVLSLLRVMSALLLMQHGTQKLLGFPAFGPDRGPPAMFTMSWTAGVFELVGGVLLAIGLFTRPVAFLLSGVMAFAYFLVHAGRDFYPLMNGGELAALYCFVFFFFVFSGPGPWSVDKVLGKA